MVDRRSWFYTKDDNSWTEFIYIIRIFTNYFLKKIFSFGMRMGGVWRSVHHHWHQSPVIYICSLFSKLVHYCIMYRCKNRTPIFNFIKMNFSTHVFFVFVCLGFFWFSIAANRLYFISDNVFMGPRFFLYIFL